MSWIQRYRLRLYVRNSIWILPTLSIVAAIISVSLLNRIERAMGWQMRLGPETGRVVMGAIVSSMFSLVVLGSSAILVAVQLASAQLTPRIISMVYRVGIRKVSLAAFVFTFTFSLAVLVRIGESVPLLTGYLAAYGFLFNLALFIYFVDRMGKALRPSAVLQYVALAGRAVVESVYPRPFPEGQAEPPEPAKLFNVESGRTIINIEDGVVLAFDLKGLVALAERSNCLIQIVPEVGDYIAEGDPLFCVFQGGQDLSDEELRNSIAFGPERTVEQDPMFAFRIIVDIAAKALSPAINDPTTAVLAIDQIHHLLRDVGSRYLSDGQERDRNGQVRLLYRTPNWEDFVSLAVTEIRQYGRDSIQVMRRLRAMLDNLIITLPDRRASLLRKELGLLDSSSRRVFPDADDQVLAETSDLQGMGGSRVQDLFRASTPAVPELEASAGRLANHGVVR